MLKEYQWFNSRLFRCKKAIDSRMCQESIETNSDYYTITESTNCHHSNVTFILV